MTKNGFKKLGTEIYDWPTPLGFIHQFALTYKGGPNILAWPCTKNTSKAI